MNFAYDPLTIANDFVARLALYMATALSVTVLITLHDMDRIECLLRSKANTTSILLKLRVIQTLLERKRTRP